MPIDEHLLLWHSVHKNNAIHDNCKCSVYFPIHAWLTDVVGFRVKSISLTHLFPNIYGMHKSLFIDTGTITELVIPTGNVKTVAALDSLLQPLIQAVVGGAVTVVTDADNFMTITSTFPFRILTNDQVTAHNGNKTSLNQLIGQRNDTAVVLTPYTFTDPVNLTGVRKLRLGSTQMASSRSIHATGDSGDIIASISLHDVDYGYSKTFEFEDSSNVTSYFRATRQCPVIDLEITDEYEQTLSLPENAHLDVEFMITTRS